MKHKVTLRIEAGKGLRNLMVENDTTIENLYRRYEDKLTHEVVAAKLDNKVVELTTKVRKDCRIEFVDMRTETGNTIYQHGLSLIYLKAVEDVLGRVEVEIEHALSRGLYTVINRKEPVTAKEVKAIQKRMGELVAQDIPFGKKKMTREEALAGLDNLWLHEKRRLLERSTAKSFRYYELDGFQNFFYGLMVPSTGYIKVFALRKYKGGVILRYPHESDPKALPPFEEERKIYEAFEEAKRWRELLGISYVTDLNDKIDTGAMKEVIQLSEALHEKRIVEIAKEITEKKKRIILIAGPSSSGKTSFARRLLVQLKVNGLRPLYLGTDDYFVDRQETPLDENGEKDYENLGALDVKLFNKNMNDLLAGKKVDLPTFDFMRGEKVFGKRITSLEKGQPIVIEGIHALNGTLTAEIPGRQKYKIYISPLTQLCIDSHNRIPLTDARMLRRMVRDFNYRGHSAQDTIREWPKVRRGEAVNIFPYSKEADAFFNSVHIYELAVLKKYAEPLLKAIKREEPEYAEAARLLRFLSFIETYPHDEYIVNNSLLREFIGGSVFFS